jgi:hypothetical protein
MQRTIASLPEGKKKLANGGKVSKMKLRDSKGVLRVSLAAELCSTGRGSKKNDRK